MVNKNGVTTMKKKLSMILSMLSLFLGLSATGDMPPAGAQAEPRGQGTILFVPHDNRPTSCEQSAEALELAGYKVLMPPKNMLGGLREAADTKQLWRWVKKNIQEADVAVVSTDSLIYGGLVTSRNHQEREGELLSRADSLEDLREENRRVKIYAFGSLMRTPKNGAAAGAEEPDYYQEYGDKIFKLSALRDQGEIRQLSPEEQGEYDRLQATLPADVVKDYFQRREKNIKVTKRLMDFAKKGTINFLVIGKDDNAPFCATHQEARQLTAYSQDLSLSKNKFLITNGIDELGMLLLTRAMTYLDRKPYNVNVKFNMGTGGDTIPKFSDAKIHNSIKDELLIAGALETDSVINADLVLLVNTDYKGRTTDGYPDPGDPEPMYNNGQPRNDSQYFLDMVKNNVAKGRNAALADIAFANGSDNALMTLLGKNKLLFRLCSYSGWNTATNSAGFALGQGLVSLKLPQEKRNDLLIKRYLDDWGYQANVREELMKSLPSGKYYMNLAEYEPIAVDFTTQRLRSFAAKYLNEYPNVTDLKVTFPWHITFIGGITINEGAAPLKNLKFYGRWNIGRDQATCGYGATYIKARFNGTGIAAKMEDKNCWWRYTIDGKEYKRIKFTNEITNLAQRLPEGDHEIKLIRSTEGEAGLSIFKGFVLDEGARLLKMEESHRPRLEFIGDSITAGAFNDGARDALNYHDVEDNDMSYGPQLARMLKADYSVLGKSGEGLVHNYSEEWPYNQVHTADRYPWTYYSFDWTEEHPAWDFAQNQSDAIFISIGTNDFIFDPQPTEDEFIKGYKNLINVVRGHNPQTPIICLEPVPVIIGPRAGAWTQKAVHELMEQGDKQLYYIPLNDGTPLLTDADYVGDGVHPTKEGSRKIAQYLKPIVEKIIKNS